MKAVLKAQLRDVKKDKPNQLRSLGEMPAELYGHGVANVHLRLKSQDVARVFEKTGESQLVELQIANEKKARNVLIHEVAKDTLYNKFLHVDFYQVRMDEKIVAEVPLVFEGESEAVKTLGGILIKNFHTLKIRALPNDLPADLKINIEKLKTLEDKILVKDITVPRNVEILVQPDDMVASVAPPRTEAELAALEEKVKEDVAAVKVAEKEAKIPEEPPPETQEKPQSKQPSANK